MRNLPVCARTATILTATVSCLKPIFQTSSANSSKGAWKKIGQRCKCWPRRPFRSRSNSLNRPPRFRLRLEDGSTENLPARQAIAAPMRAACLSRLSGSGAPARPQILHAPIDRRPRFPKAGLSLLLPPTKSRTKVPGKSQVKLGNRNADIQTSATRSVRSLLNRRACIPLGKIAKLAPPVRAWNWVASPKGRYQGSNSFAPSSRLPWLELGSFAYASLAFDSASGSEP